MLSPQRHPSLSPFLALSVGILAASTASIFIRYAQQLAPSLVIAAWRLTIATVILTPITLARQRAELQSLKHSDLRLAIFSGFFLAIHFATWISSLEFTTVASSVVLVSTTPLWVALLSPFTLKEPLSKLAVIGMLIALIGGSIVGISDACSWAADGLSCPPLAEFFHGQAFLGDLLALAGALAAAIYLIIGRRLRAHMSLIGYIYVVYGMAALALLGMMFVAGLPALGYSPQVYLWFFLLALVPQLLGHSSFNYALGYLSASYVSITLLSEPIASTVLAYILLDETPGILKIIGAILILLGIYTASRSEIHGGEQTSP
jgi:drug/metabolite transporter (DMT)-like permease